MKHTFLFLWALEAIFLFAPSTSTAALLPKAASLSATHEIQYDQGANSYTLTATGSHTVTYVLDLDDPDLQRGMLRISASVDRGPFFHVLDQAGTRYRNTQGQILEPAQYASAGALYEHHVQGDEIVLVFQEQPASNTLQKTYRLSLQGLSLVIHFQSDSTQTLDGYAGVNLGWAQAQGQDTRVVQIPYLPIPICMLPAGTVLSAFVDPSTSSAAKVNSATGIGDNGTLYCHSRTLSVPNTSGEQTAMDETAYVTLSSELSHVYVAPDTQPSDYRSLLSDKLLLDVWGLQGEFSAPEGVELAWQTAEQDEVHAVVQYADVNESCGNGVELVLSTSSTQLARIRILNGDMETHTWESDVSLDAGDELRFAVLRAGDNACDGTLLKVQIASSQDTFDSVVDFSDTQGQRGFYYRELIDQQRVDMTYNQAQGWWEGQGNFSILGAGFAHPGTGKTSYLDAKNMVERYAEYGLLHLAIIFHVWQRWGYDQGLPDHYPANPDLGTSEQMADFIETAKQAGMLLALHENYTDIYPDNPPDYPSPLWDPTAIALSQSGERKLGWYHPVTHQQAFVIAADRMLEFSQLESRAIAADYAPNAAYLDVTTGWNPSRAIDHTSSAGKKPTMAWAFNHTVDLFDFIRDVYSGPLLGEGGEGSNRFDSFFAGHLDAVERQVEGRQWAQVIPEYELQCIKPLMLNHGMGYYARYFTPYGQQPIQVTDMDLDQYRASELAFGHAGFLGDGVGGVNDWLELHAPEYWLMQAIQSEIADADYSNTEYFDGQGFISLQQALRRRQDLSRARLKISYASGASLWINRDSFFGGTNTLGGFSFEQGAYGWRYLEDQGSGPVELRWDAEKQRWQGSRTWSIIASNYMHPDGQAIIRTYRVPSDATVSIETSLSDADTSCGDGVMARLQLNGSDLWTCALAGDTQEPCQLAPTEVPVLAGDEISLRVEPKSDNSCDTTSYYMNLKWQDELQHDWTIEGPNGPVLPPSGFYFYSPVSQTKAGTLIDNDSGQIADFVSSAAYSYTRSRNGTLLSLGDLNTDGAVALVHGSQGQDIHGQRLTMAQSAEHPLLNMSTRADFNLRFVDSDKALVSVRNLAQGQTLDASYSDLPQFWLDELALHPDNLSLCPSDQEGELIGECHAVQVDESGTATLAQLEQGQTYLLWLKAGCSGADCCGDGTCDSDEDCSTCPQDCRLGQSQICCDGIMVDGDCCTDDHCPAGQDCVENSCVESTDGGRDAGVDGGEQDGAGSDGYSADAGADNGSETSYVANSGCGCSSSHVPGSVWFVLLLFPFIIRRAKRKQKNC